LPDVVHRNVEELVDFLHPLSSQALFVDHNEDGVPQLSGGMESYYGLSRPTPEAQDPIVRF
jgi:hypothetical protein